MAAQGEQQWYRVAARRDRGPGEYHIRSMSGIEWLRVERTVKDPGEFTSGRVKTRGKGRRLGCLGPVLRGVRERSI